MMLMGVNDIIQSIPWDTLKAVGEFVCPRCNSKYSHKGNFQRHIRYECGQPHRYKCQICGQGTTRRNTLFRHMRDKHNIYSNIMPSANTPLPTNS